MPIVTASRWDIKQDVASRVGREAAPLLKAQGATRVSVGHIRTGQHVGQTVITVEYQNWETFGQAMQKMHDDTAYHQLFRQAIENNGAKIQGRTVIATEDHT